MCDKNWQEAFDFCEARVDEDRRLDREIADMEKALQEQAEEKARLDAEYAAACEAEIQKLERQQRVLQYMNDRMDEIFGKQ